MSRPVGRVLCSRLRGAAVIHLGLPLPAASCGLPASIGRAALNRSRRERVAPLLTLLRVGFTEPPQSPAALVVSYTTVSPLPLRWRAGAVCFLWHCPAGHPGSALPTTLPCGARTFLTGLAPGATARPTHPCSGYAVRYRAGVADRSSDAVVRLRPRQVLAADRQAPRLPQAQCKVLCHPQFCKILYPERAAFPAPARRSHAP